MKYSDTFWSFSSNLSNNIASSLSFSSFDIVSILNWGYVELATKWLQILSLSGNDKIRNHLVANPIALFCQKLKWMYERSLILIFNIIKIWDHFLLSLKIYL